MSDPNAKPFGNLFRALNQLDGILCTGAGIYPQKRNVRRLVFFLGFESIHSVGAMMLARSLSIRYYNTHLQTLPRDDCVWRLILGDTDDYLCFRLESTKSDANLWNQKQGTYAPAEFLAKDLNNLRENSYDYFERKAEELGTVEGVFNRPPRSLDQLLTSDHQGERTVGQYIREVLQLDGYVEV